MWLGEAEVAWMCFWVYNRISIDGVQKRFVNMLLRLSKACRGSVYGPEVKLLAPR